MNNKLQMMWPVLMTLALVFVLFASVGMPAIAQDSPTPTPRPNRNDPEVFYAEPAVSEGDAEWTLGERTFESFYPNGFTFTIQAESSAGEISDASVDWSHGPRNQLGGSGAFDEDTGVFVVRYPGIEIDSLPPWVAVNYRWKFTDEAGNSYISEWFRGDEYYVAGGGWERFESEDIIAFVEDGLPPETGQLTLDAMAAQRETYRQAWGALLSNKPRAILFSNRASWNEWRRGTSNPNVIGITSSDWGGVAQVVSGGDVIDLAYGTVLHEVGHLYQSEFAAAAFSPGSWWIEGNATFFELSQQYDYEQRVRNLAANGQLPALLDGTGPSPQGTGPDGIGRIGYDIGYTFFKWLTLNYGLDAHHELVEAIRGNRPRNQVLEEITGLPADEIESRWRVWLGASPTAPTLIPSPTFFFPPTVTPFGQ